MSNWLTIEDGGWLLVTVRGRAGAREYKLDGHALNWNLLGLSATEDAGTRWLAWRDQLARAGLPGLSVGAACRVGQALVAGSAYFWDRQYHEAHARACEAMRQKHGIRG